jgi:ABC-type polysaccharide/polyol phosphate transport system ATPase subunit
VTAIKLDNVTKRYKRYGKSSFYLRDQLTTFLRHLSLVARSTPGESGAFWALRDVSFQVQRGEAVGIIGRNGAGKSTILKLLAGVSRPSSGTVLAHGRIAPLIEVGAGFHPELTGRENMYLNGSILGMKKAQVDRQFDEIVAFAELADFIDMPVKHYSSGMYVRLGFAIAAHVDPDIYLVDEVLAVGDQGFREKCLDHLRGQQAAGKTMVLVSHQLPVVEQFCDRVVYLREGQIRFEGPPSVAVERYLSDLHVADKERAASLVEGSFLDSRGNQVDALETAPDELVIRVRFEAHRGIEDVVVNLALWGPSGHSLVGFSSDSTGFRMDAGPGEHAIYCWTRGLPLQTGRHQLSVVLRSRGQSVYDVHDRRHRLHVQQGVQPGDVLRVEARWSHEGPSG